jgi:sialic acid synthase SpsE/spore coat polysaccharide biosynthesis protein SpsF (cytidylyltransferase family)
MKIGIIILSRYSSSRLPGKALIEIGGRSVLGHIVDRLKRAAGCYPVIVATSNKASDDPIERFCRHSLVACFRGDLENVSQRFADCSEEWSLDYAVRVNGDNLFTDPDILKAMLAIAETDCFDFITNLPGRTFPYGMSVEIVRTSFYKQTLSRQTSEQQEHVTSWLYDNESIGRRYYYLNKTCADAQGLQLALDTPEDLQRFESIASRSSSHPSKLSMREVVRLANSSTSSPWRGKHGPLLIAEIGGNHEGSFDAAKELTRQAISTGVDYVKFQLYRGDTLVSSYESPDRNAHFKRFELSRVQHIELAEMCQEGGVGYMASVWDLEMLEWIDSYMPIYKIGSGDLTAWPIIKEFAKREKPIILSTGLATLDEVMQTVAQIQSVDCRYCDPYWLCILQCTSMYPISAADANLQVMSTLKQATGLSTGYSDHTEGGVALRIAAAMGAEVLEFHFTDTRKGKVFRDHKVSLTPQELIALQNDLDMMHVFKGDGLKRPQPSEIEEGHVLSFRRGAYLPYPAKAGQMVNPRALRFLRPNHGLDARDSDLAVEQYLTLDSEPFQRLTTHCREDE